MEENKILSVAEKNFFAQKYNDVKLDNIANDLGIKKPSLYYYYKDKKALFIATLKYSEKIFLKRLKEIIKKNNLLLFLERYLTFPYVSKNLFGIAFQQEYCIDNEVRTLVLTGKLHVYEELKLYFQSFGLNEIKTYLIMNLLEKISQTNCQEGNCLKYDIRTLSKEIEEMIK